MEIVSLGMRAIDRVTLLRFTKTGWDYVLFEDSAGRAKARRLHGHRCKLRTVDCRRLKPHDVVAAIDVEGLAGDARAAVGKQECGGSADFRGIDVALQRSSLDVSLQHVAES
jgi:hypothetical protein